MVVEPAFALPGSSFDEKALVEIEIAPVPRVLRNAPVEYAVLSPVIGETVMLSKHSPKRNCFVCYAICIIRTLHTYN